MSQVDAVAKEDRVFNKLDQLQQQCFQRAALQREIHRISQQNDSKGYIVLVALFVFGAVASRGDMDGWWFAALIIVTLGALYWDSKREDRMPGIKLEGVVTMASNYAALMTIKRFKDCDSVEWHIVRQSEDGDKAVTIKGFNRFDTASLRDEYDVLSEFMELSPAERKNKFVGLKLEVMPVLRAGQAYAKSVGIELDYTLKSLITR